MAENVADMVVRQFTEKWTGPAIKAYLGNFVGLGHNIRVACDGDTTPEQVEAHLKSKKVPIVKAQGHFIIRPRYQYPRYL